MNMNTSTNNTEPRNWHAKFIPGLLLLCGVVTLGFFCNHIEKPIGVPDRPWEVYFSEVYDGPLDPKDPDSLENRLIDKLYDAETSIDAALQELDSEPIANALIAAHQCNVTVRLVTETDYIDETPIESLKAEGISVVDDKRSGSLMHNKFIVIDKRYVWTGSYNTTDNGAHKNNNNVIFFDSAELADNFTQEFEEMFCDREFGKKSDKNIPHPQVTLSDDTQVFTYFAPENDTISALLDEINSAKQSIYFMAFVFTHHELGKKIRERFENEIKVEGVFESLGSGREFSQYKLMDEAGIRVFKDTNPAMMHHKVMIIDEKTVITGSYNFSESAADDNCENLLIIKNNRDIAQAYLAEFNRLKE